MELATKSDLVLVALRKIGVASDATLSDVEPQSIEDGLNDLEMMMHEWALSGISTNYQFSDDHPQSGDEHGLNNDEIRAVIYNLALIVAPDYEVQPSLKIIATAARGKELLTSQSVMKKSKKRYYPNRTPIGSGNRGLSSRFFRG